VWGRPLLTLRAAATGSADHETAKPVYRTEFLVPRPILRAVRLQGPVVLLIDEIDRADDEFEAFLLQVLERGDVTIPELDEQYPVRSDLRIVLTSNRSREVHDALKRRCVYRWIEHPTVAQEAQILHTLRRDLPVRLADDVAQLMGGLREIGALTKKPAVSEALDLVDGIVALGRDALTPEVVDAFSVPSSSTVTIRTWPAARSPHWWRGSGGNAAMTGKGNDR
jgi:MoxR-like ATPase